MCVREKDSSAKIVFRIFTKSVVILVSPHAGEFPCYTEQELTTGTTAPGLAIRDSCGTELTMLVELLQQQSHLYSPVTK